MLVYKAPLKIAKSFLVWLRQGESYSVAQTHSFPTFLLPRLIFFFKDTVSFYGPAVLELTMQTRLTSVSGVLGLKVWNTCLACWLARMHTSADMGL